MKVILQNKERLIENIGEIIPRFCTVVSSIRFNYDIIV